MINTLQVILEQALLHVPLVLGAYISFSLLKVPDLSIESAYVVGACTGAQVLKMALSFSAVSSGSLDVSSNLGLSISLIASLIMSLFFSLAAGALVGFTSSSLTQKGGLSHLLSSIVTSGLFHGINQYFFPSYFSLAGLSLAELTGGQTEHVLLMAIAGVLVLLFYLLFKTQLGYSYAVYGTNPHFFEHYGISTHYVFSSGVILANALAGLSGYLVGLSSTCVELNMGVGKALFCITALILGACVSKKSGGARVVVPLSGLVLYFTLQQLLLKFGFNLKYFTAVQALIVVCIFLHSNKNVSHKSRTQVGV